MPSVCVAGHAASVDVGREGITAVTYFATDAAGNDEAARELSVRIDRTRPEGSLLPQYALPPDLADVPHPPTPAYKGAVKNKTDMHITFDGGVLEMHCAYAQRTDGMYSDGEIRDLLLQKL